MRNTAGRVALITGAATGLGSVIAAELHAAGYRVAVGDIDEAGVHSLAAALDPTGATALGLALDVREKPHFEEALRTLLARWGAAHVLVNNAAVTEARPLMEISPEGFDDVMAVNVRGAFLGCQVFGAYFRDQGHGRIVNMASLAGQNGGVATGAHYAVSKGALLTVTKVFARDLAAAGVTVNALAPGPLDTPAVHRIVPAEDMGALRANIPVGDIGDPCFVASLVVRLASVEAAFTTGATWDINGGLFMR